jgi:glutathione peroxidase
LFKKSLDTNSFNTIAKQTDLIDIDLLKNVELYDNVNNKKIADFCENTYGVKFPMFSKTTVRGSDASPLFKQLTKLTDTAPKWNFYKYLISRDGQKVQSFNSTTDPLAKGFLSEVDKLVAAQTP